MQHTYIGIDPSIISTGIAIVNNDMLQPISVINSTSSDVSYHQRSLDMATTIVTTLEAAICKFSLHRTLLMEVPEHWGNTKGEASERSESVQKLYCLVGILLHRLLYGCKFLDHVCIITPSKWKGQVKKHITEARLQAYLERYNCPLPVSTPNDVYDAIGIAKFAQTHIKFNDNRPGISTVPNGCIELHKTTYNPNIKVECLA